MTEAWSIVVVLLGCPVILGLLLMVLSAVEDSLTQPPPAEPDPVVETRSASQAPVHEGAPA